MPENESQPAVKYLWQQFVLDAFMEFRPERLPAKINAAERAISARLRDSNAPDLEESTAIRDALRSLRVLFSEAKGDGRDFGENKEIA
jgi:hypothetical protein